VPVFQGSLKIAHRRYARPGLCRGERLLCRFSPTCERTSWRLAGRPCWKSLSDCRSGLRPVNGAALRVNRFFCFFGRGPRDVGFLGFDSAATESRARPTTPLFFLTRVSSIPTRRRVCRFHLSPPRHPGNGPRPTFSPAAIEPYLVTCLNFCVTRLNAALRHCLSQDSVYLRRLLSGCRVSLPHPILFFFP